MPSICPENDLIRRQQAILMGEGGRFSTLPRTSFLVSRKAFPDSLAIKQRKTSTESAETDRSQEDSRNPNPLCRICYIRRGKRCTEGDTWENTCKEEQPERMLRCWTGRMRTPKLGIHQNRLCCLCQEVAIKCVRVIYVHCCDCPERRKDMLFPRFSSTSLVKTYFIAQKIYVAFFFFFAQKTSFYWSISDVFFFPP